jgi:hypothetical protein
VSQTFECVFDLVIKVKQQNTTKFEITIVRQEYCFLDIYRILGKGLLPVETRKEDISALHGVMVSS